MNILEANGGQHPWTNLMCCDHPNMHESENQKWMEPQIAHSIKEEKSGCKNK